MTDPRRARASPSVSTAGEPYELVYADVDEPAIDGIAFPAAVARRTAPDRLATILISSVERRAGQRALLKTGAAGLINKPIRRADFVRVSIAALQAPVAAATPKPNRTMREAPPPDADADVERDGLAHLRVLVVEDNLVNQRLVRLQLQKLGLRADLAANGLEALQALDRARYDVVLMDCQMPDMDGYEATRRLRANGRHHAVRVIAMTANAMQGDREKCLAAGMDDYIPKPIREAELRAALARAVADEASDAG